MKKISVLLVLIAICVIYLVSCVPGDGTTYYSEPQNNLTDTDSSLVFRNGRVSTYRFTDDVYKKVCYVLISSYSDEAPSIYCLDN